MADAFAARGLMRAGARRQDDWTAISLAAPTAAGDDNRPMSDGARSLPIAVFDSGIGGLTVLHELLVSLPEEDYLYLGDTDGFPYGTKSRGVASRPRIDDACPLPARPRGQAAGDRLQLGDLGGRRTSRARSPPSTGSRCSRWSTPRRRSRRRSPSGPGRRARDADHGRGRAPTGARSAHASGRELEVTEVAAPDLAPIIQNGFPFDRAGDGHRALLLRAAEAGRRRHPDPRLHPLPARRPDAAADARAATCAWSPPATRSPRPPSGCSRRRGLETRGRARATTASSAPATSTRSASSAPASCRCRWARSSGSSIDGSSRRSQRSSNRSRHDRPGRPPATL